jgi:hypothetical protein
VSFNSTISEGPGLASVPVVSSSLNDQRKAVAQV